MLRLYRGGPLPESAAPVWLSTEFDFAAAFAELADAKHVWEVSVDLRPADILDVIHCGSDATCVVQALRAAGISVPDPLSHQIDFPAAVIRTAATDAIRQAEYRGVRLRDWVDWDLGAGRQEADALYLVDVTAIVNQWQVRLPDAWNFQQDGRRRPGRRRRRSR